MFVAALIDTNILVYRFDNRFPESRKFNESLSVPRKTIYEFLIRRLLGLETHAVALKL